METRQISVLLEQAEVQRRLGNHRDATELVQRALTIDPDHAQAHAALAFTLLGARRLPGAVIEARLALGLDANDPYIHHVVAAVLAAQRKLDDAWAHCLVALEGPLATPEAHVLGARIRTLQGEVAHVKELLQEALELDPAHTGALTRLAGLIGELPALSLPARSAIALGFHLGHSIRLSEGVRGSGQAQRAESACRIGVPSLPGAARIRHPTRRFAHLHRAGGRFSVALRMHVRSPYPFAIASQA